VTVTDDHDNPRVVRVTIHWSGFASGANAMSWDGDFFGSVGPVPFPGKQNSGGTLDQVWVTATDSEGATSTLFGTKIAVRPCPDRVIVP
jgi:putative peptide zinc metalloprotease protein